MSWPNLSLHGVEYSNSGPEAIWEEPMYQLALTLHSCQLSARVLGKTIEPARYHTYGSLSSRLLLWILPNNDHWVIHVPFGYQICGLFGQWCERVKDVQPEFILTLDLTQ